MQELELNIIHSLCNILVGLRHAGTRASTRTNFLIFFLIFINRVVATVFTFLNLFPNLHYLLLNYPGCHQNGAYSTMFWKLANTIQIYFAYVRIICKAFIM